MHLKSQKVLFVYFLQVTHSAESSFESGAGKVAMTPWASNNALNDTEHHSALKKTNTELFFHFKYFWKQITFWYFLFELEDNFEGQHE